MRLLILGGTRFLGRYVADAALRAGHEVTLFTRGATNPDLFPEAEHLHGDRDGNLGALAGRAWDVAIDPSGYVPRVVAASADAVDADHYVFISSISVYARMPEIGTREDAAVERVPQDSENVAEHYGGLKALCEQVVAERFPDRHLNLRAGLIVGPHDYTDRFTYWARRTAMPGPVLAPAPADRPVQLIDVRDLADWIVRAAQERVTGTMNAVGEPFAFGRILDGADVTWAPPEWLLEQRVEPWSELPVWLGTDPHFRGFLAADSSRARAAGLQARPLAETIADTRAWAQDHPFPGGAGLTPARERELLDALAARAAGS
jgi:2'-hydroxyisoflavone reductase